MDWLTASLPLFGCPAGGFAGLSAGRLDGCLGDRLATQLGAGCSFNDFGCRPNEKATVAVAAAAVVTPKGAHRR